MENGGEQGVGEEGVQLGGRRGGRRKERRKEEGEEEGGRGGRVEEFSCVLV